MPILVITAEGTTEKYSIEAGTVTLGRGLESDIRLKDIKASRRHCQVVKGPQGFKVVDLASGNGTFLNGVQITEQPLKNGDKIQIGTTTIAFDMGKQSQTKVRKPATAATKARTASGPQPAQTATAPAKAATGKVPAATAQAKSGGTQKRKTSVAPTVKMSTTDGKTGTRSVAAQKGGGKTGTGRISKTGTGRMATAQTGKTKRSGTQRMGTTTRKGGRAATGRVSRTEKFTSDAGKKKANPAIVIGAVCGGILLIVIIIIFAGGGGAVSGEQKAVHDFTELMKAARIAEDTGDYDLARNKGQEALALVDSISEEGGRKDKKREAEGFLKELEDLLQRSEIARTKWEEFKGAFDDKAKRGPKTWRDMEDWAKKLKNDFPSQPWSGELQKCLDTITRLINTDVATERAKTFQAARNRIDGAHITGGKNEYGPAIKAWQTYLQDITDGNAKNKATQQIESLNIMANTEIRRLSTKVNNGSLKKAELQKMRFRFEGSKHIGAFDELVTKAK